MRPGPCSPQALGPPPGPCSPLFSHLAQIKCDQYWPNRGTETYGFIQVTLLDTIELATFCVRTFSLHKVGPALGLQERAVGQRRETGPLCLPGAPRGTERKSNTRTQADPIRGWAH